MWLMDVQRREAWISEPKLISRSAWNLGRHLLATFWTRSKQPWVVLPDEQSHVFETQPDDIFAFFNSVVAKARGATA